MHGSKSLSSVVREGPLTAAVLTFFLLPERATSGRSVWRGHTCKSTVALPPPKPLWTTSVRQVELGKANLHRSCGSPAAAPAIRPRQHRAGAAARSRAGPPPPTRGCSRRSAPPEARSAAAGFPAPASSHSSLASPRPITLRRNGRGLSRAVHVGHGDAFSLHVSAQGGEILPGYARDNGEGQG
jgi:hypothetical protein